MAPSGDGYVSVAIADVVCDVLSLIVSCDVI